MAELEVTELTAGYRGVEVLNKVSFDVRIGELLLLVGPNGAGKSTLLRTIIGVHRQRSGSIRLNGVQVEKLAANRRARMGVAWIPEGRGVISQLTVRENLDLAHFGGGWRPEARRDSLARFPVLAAALDRPAGTLSGGEQQMLALARAMETGARLLLIDEPTLGLAPKVVDTVLDQLADLRKQGFGILLVEQRAVQVRHIADRMLIIRRGRLEFEALGGQFDNFDFNLYSNDSQEHVT